MNIIEYDENESNNPKRRADQAKPTVCLLSLQKHACIYVCIQNTQTELSYFGSTLSTLFLVLHGKYKIDVKEMWLARFELV